MFCNKQWSFKFRGKLHRLAKKKIPIPAKMKGDLYRFDVAESRYGNQNVLSPTTLKEERFKVSKYVFD
jgi:hypothetical protein